MSNFWNDAVGSLKTYFRIGRTGPRLKDVSGNLVVRNPGDTADADITGAVLHASGDSIEINSDAADSGVDRKLTLARNPAGSAALTVQFPAAKGTDGYVVRQKPGTAAGVLELELVAPTSTAANGVADTTNLAFGSTSPVAMLTLSATAVIDRIQTIVDTAFNGSPTASIGITGQTSKYVPSSEIDLTAAGVYESHPGLPAAGAPEPLIITYSAGGASAGAARILIYYTDAPA